MDIDPKKEIKKGIEEVVDKVPKEDLGKVRDVKDPLTRVESEIRSTADKELRIEESPPLEPKQLNDMEIDPKKEIKKGIEGVVDREPKEDLGKVRDVKDPLARVESEIRSTADKELRIEETPLKPKQVKDKIVQEIQR